MTSPIEMMIDKACGVEVRTAGEQLGAEVKALLALADAAKTWKQNPSEINAVNLRLAAEAWEQLGG